MPCSAPRGHAAARDALAVRSATRTPCPECWRLPRAASQTARSAGQRSASIRLEASTERIVADAGPLIALARIGALDLLLLLRRQAIVPEAVLVLARRRGALPALAPVLRRLRGAGYNVSCELVQHALSAVGEGATC